MTVTRYCQSLLLALKANHRLLNRAATSMKRQKDSPNPQDFRPPSSEGPDSKIMATGTKLLGPVVKSPVDERDYLAFELSNKLTVLVISDPETELAAVALSVLVGSYSDPEELPGLAHYLEHMLFLGTEKFPVENDYASYLSQNGGSSNAYTAGDSTCYYFDCSPDKLEGALDRFSQFFISPLFTESGSEREVNAVNSEHEGRKTDDSERAWRVESMLCDPSHPYAKFNIGNKETLWNRPQSRNINVREELIKFHQQHYSSNIMKLVIVSDQPCVELKTLAEKYFNDIRNIDVDIQSWPISPFRDQDLKKRVDVVSIQDLRDVELTFAIPEYKNYIHTGTCSYLTGLINQVGPGSLHAMLKAKNFATTVCAYTSFSGRGFGFMTVYFDLTPLGYEHIDDVIYHFFQFVQLLKQEGPQRWYWEELKTMKDTMFRFLEKEAADSLSTSCVEKMTNYPPEEVWTCKYTQNIFSERWITEILSRLHPSKVRVLTRSRENSDAATDVEEYYGVRYRHYDIAQATIQSWINCGTSDNLKLPPPNIFLPSEFELKPRDMKNDKPRIILDNELSRVWFMQDNVYLRPLAYIRLDLITPLCRSSPLNFSLIGLFDDVLSDILDEECSCASQAGLNYSLSPGLHHFRVQITGYDHKVGLLLSKILAKLTNFSIDESRFQDLRELYVRELENFKDYEPRVQADDYASKLLSDSVISHQDVLKTIDELTFDALKSFVKKLVGNVKLQWQIYGNFTEEDALKLYSDGVAFFNQSSSLYGPQLTKSREVEIPAGRSFVFRADHLSHKDSSVNILLQCPRRDIIDIATIKLVQHILDEPCFDILRTKEQLGYIVGCSQKASRGAVYLVFRIQGDKHPDYLNSKVESFLQEMKIKMEGLTQEEFVQFKESLAQIYSEKPKTLYSRCNELDAQIFTSMYNFHERDVLIQAIKDVSLEQVQAYYNTWIDPTSTTRKKLSVHVLSRIEGGAGHPDASVLAIMEPIKPAPEDIEDYVSWRTERKVLPHPKPYIQVPPMKTRSTLNNSSTPGECCRH